MLFAPVSLEPTHRNSLAAHANNSKPYTQQDMSSSMQMSVVHFFYPSSCPFLPHISPTLITSRFLRPLRVIHSALCTRVLLNLRQAEMHSSIGIDTNDVAWDTTLAFEPWASADLDGGYISLDGLDC